MTFDELIHRERQIAEARKAMLVTDEWNATDTMRELCWKVLTGRAPVVAVPGGAG